VAQELVPPVRPVAPGDAPGYAGRVLPPVLRAVLSARALRAAAVEVAWVGAHVATYPFGLARERVPELSRIGLDGLSPVRRGMLIRDVEAAGTPILLVHGIVDNRSVFTVLRRGLMRRGFGRVSSVNYRGVHRDVPTLARQLAEEVERACEESGYERVHLVGHSLGGLIARYYVQRLGGDARVHTLVTLGTPHQGTVPARLVPLPLVRDLRPGSPLLAELAAPAPNCRTRFVAVWSDLDQVVVPQRNATIDHPDLRARNVCVPAVGHLSLPIDGRVVHEICTTLAHVEPDGSTAASGVTSITSTSSVARRARRSASPRRPRSASPSHPV
jgi:pimeloyl-ACP methyl ester carboxylesterase